ncbi:hypothetical protein GCM10022297_07770 [Lactobacillus hamsteri]
MIKLILKVLRQFISMLNIRHHCNYMYIYKYTYHYMGEECNRYRVNTFPTLQAHHVN